MRFLRRSLVGLFLTGLSLGLMAMAIATVTGAVQSRMAGEDADRPARERVFAVDVVEITPQTVRPVMTAYGEIRSRRTLELRAPMGGVVVELAPGFAEGARVAAGDVLVRIDAADATGRRDAARADLREAEADLREARRGVGLARDELAASEAQADLRARSLARQRDLQERGVGSAAQVEDAELQVSAAGQAVLARRQALADTEARIDQAASTVDRLSIALEEAERRLSETVVTAPFDGRLAEVTAVTGALVSSSEQLARLIDPETLEVAFRISASQHARLLDGDGRLLQADVAVSLDVSGVDMAAEGRITRDSPAVGEGQTGRLLFASLDGSAGFRPGDFVTVRITEAPMRGVARLPAAALDAAQTVLAIGPDERLEIVAVPILRRQGDEVLVAAADLAGRQVVAERTPFLGAGIKVRVLGAGTPDLETPGADAPGGDVGAGGDGMVELDDDRRARLVAFVESNTRMPAEVRERMLGQLRAPRVPAGVVARIEERMGG